MDYISESDNYQKHLGWKTLGVFIVTFVVGWIGGIVVGLASRQIGLRLNLSEPAGHTLSWIGVSTARLVVWIPATRFVLKRPLSQIAFRRNPGWQWDLVGGVVITTLALLGIFWVSITVGWVVIEGPVWQSLPAGAFAGKLWVAFLINTLVALGEEVIFRGYLLTGLKEAWGRWPGLVIMMLLFGMVHLPAYSEKGISPLLLSGEILFAALAGGLFGLIYLRSGSLWLPISIHFAWNFVETDILNLAGDPANPNLVGFLTRLEGPLARGAPGEANALLLDWMAFALLCLGVWWWSRNRKPEQNFKIT